MAGVLTLAPIYGRAMRRSISGGVDARVGMLHGGVLWRGIGVGLGMRLS